MSDQDADSLTQDEVYDLLSNARRRFVISYLRRRREPVDIMHLSEAVAAWENDVDADALTDQQTKRVYVSLYQTHLPKLDDAGIVEYDRDSGAVALADAVDELDTYLPNGSDDEIPWQMLYLALAAVGLLLYVATMTFSLMPLSVLGIVLLALFGVLAAAQYQLSRRR